MKAYLIRVGIDSTRGKNSQDTGRFNAPVNHDTGEFVYVPIKESRIIHSELKTTFNDFMPLCQNMGLPLPMELRDQYTHLDPDFHKLTYGDVDGYDLSSNKENHRGRPLRDLQEDDFLVFYAGLKPTKKLTNNEGNLIYAIIGFYVVKEKPITAREFVKRGLKDNNAHTRCSYNDEDIIVSAKEVKSGRLERCMPIGGYEKKYKSYRLRGDLRDKWGGFSNNPTGYLQRSVILPRFAEPEKFLDWFDKQLAELKIQLIPRNN